MWLNGGGSVEGAPASGVSNRLIWHHCRRFGVGACMYSAVATRGTLCTVAHWRNQCRMFRCPRSCQPVQDRTFSEAEPDEPSSDRDAEGMEEGDVLSLSTGLGVCQQKNAREASLITHHPRSRRIHPDGELLRCAQIRPRWFRHRGRELQPKIESPRRG